MGQQHPSQHALLSKRETLATTTWDEFGPLPELDPCLDAALQAQVDRAVTRYQRKLAGKERFTDFAAMVPASVREQQP